MKNNNPPAKQLSIEKVRWSLARLWFLCAFALFAIVIGQSIFGKFGDNVRDVWSWFIPTLLPTLMLMLGVLAEGANQQVKNNRIVQASFYNLAWWLSVAYLLVLMATILLEPFTPGDPLSLYLLSNYWLGPIQGLVVAAIGYLFTSQQPASNE